MGFQIVLYNRARAYEFENALTDFQIPSYTRCSAITAAGRSMSTDLRMNSAYR